MVHFKVLTRYLPVGLRKSARKLRIAVSGPRFELRNFQIQIRSAIKYAVTIGLQFVLIVMKESKFIRVQIYIKYRNRRALLFASYYA